MKTPPKGFDSLEVRSRVAGHICRMIDAVKSDPDRLKKFGRYRIAQQVINDEITLSSLVFVKDIEPYQPDLISQRVEGIVGQVCGGYNEQKPYFVFKGGNNEQLREAREHDTHIALDSDQFPIKIRDIGYSAAIWARGPFRTVYKTVYEGQEYLGGDSKQIEFSGPTDEAIDPEDFFPYPTWVSDLHQCRMVGHRFRQARYEILSLQLDEDGYFDDVVVPVGHSEPEHASESSDDDAPEMYHVIVKLRAVHYYKDGRGDTLADVPAEDLEDAEKRPMRAYRAVVLYDAQLLLSLEEYDLPECEYFAPCMKRDINRIYPAHSLASKGLAAQTLYNDAVTGDVLAVVGAVKRPVLSTGSMGDMDTFDLEFGTVVHVPGNATFFSPPIPGNTGSAMAGIADRMERVADGAMGQSQIAQGQLPDAQQTATASAGALQGTARRVEEVQENFNAELERNIQFKQRLIMRNFRDFKRFHGDKLKTQSASDWKEKFEVGANGQGPSNNPQLEQQKIANIVQTQQALGIPFIEDLDPMAKKVAISKTRLFQGVIDNSDFSSGMENLLVELPTPPQQHGAFGLGSGGPFGGGIPGIPGGGAELLGGVDPGGIPPEILNALLGQAQGQEPAGAEPLAPVGAGY